MRRKYLKHLFLSLYIMTVVCTGAFASDTEQEIPLDPNTGFPVILNKPFIVFNEGITGSWITRIVRQTDRSNFVFKDFMAGAYFSLETKNMEEFDKKFKAFGGEYLYEPYVMEEAASKIAFIKDPDGNEIEIIEKL